MASFTGVLHEDEAGGFAGQKLCLRGGRGPERGREGLRIDFDGKDRAVSHGELERLRVSCAPDAFDANAKGRELFQGM